MARVVVVQVQRRLAVRQGRVGFAQLAQGEAEAAVDLGQVRVERQRPPVAGDLLGGPPEPVEHHAQVGEGDRARPADVDGPADQLGRGGVVAALALQHAEIEQRLGVAAVLGQDPPVEPFRLVEPPGPLVLQGERAGLVECSAPVRFHHARPRPKCWEKYTKRSVPEVIITSGPACDLYHRFNE